MMQYLHLDHIGHDILSAAGSARSLALYKQTMRTWKLMLAYPAQIFHSYVVTAEALVTNRNYKNAPIIEISPIKERRNFALPILERKGLRSNKTRYIMECVF